MRENWVQDIIKEYADDFLVWSDIVKRGTKELRAMESLPEIQDYITAQRKLFDAQFRLSEVRVILMNEVEEGETLLVDLGLSNKVLVTKTDVTKVDNVVE